jgi:hypothetical protein
MCIKMHFYRNDDSVPDKGKSSQQGNGDVQVLSFHSGKTAVCVSVAAPAIVVIVVVNSGVVVVVVIKLFLTLHVVFLLLIVFCIHCSCYFVVSEYK